MVGFVAETNDGKGTERYLTRSVSLTHFILESLDYRSIIRKIFSQRK